MEMDELRARWADFDAKLDLCLRVNHELLGAARLEKARTTLERLRAGLGVEAALDSTALLLVGAFLYEYRNEPQFFLPALGIHLIGIAFLGHLIRQLVLVGQVVHDGPVAAMQRRLETLRVLRLRELQAVMVCGPLLWPLLLIVVCKGVFGVDLYAAVSQPWLVANVLFGAFWAFAGLWAIHRYTGDPEAAGFRRLLDAVSESRLNEARDFLARLADFEEESEARTPTGEG
jgi:hypothetical protein